MPRFADCVVNPLQSTASLQHAEYSIAYRFHGAYTANFYVFWCARGTAFGPVGVISDQRLGLGVVYVKPLFDGLLRVVRALHQSFASNIVFAGNLGWIEDHMVGASRSRMDAAP